MKEVIAVIIPALNEQDAIGRVLVDISEELVDEVVVVDNGSSDQTVIVAEKYGATVLMEARKGYGHACMKGIRYFEDKEPRPHLIVFIDADYSDYPQEISQVVAPITEDNYDLVIGSRALGKRERGSMTFPQIFGNWLATLLIRIFFNHRFTDLGPFRAIKFEKLLTLDMQEYTYGWTVEMQLKAAKIGLRCTEVPVSYRKRIGVSKVSGTVKGTVMAGYRILWTIFKAL